MHKIKCRCTQCVPIGPLDVWGDVYYTSKSSCRTKKYTLVGVRTNKDGTKLYTLQGYARDRLYYFKTQGPLERA
ncbi:MAG: hypothetical protein JSV86_06570 [Gemmatimonadota bacterium]|nr:MAG: hypothetical protein JSV86_06570 [Gemmatimonadota bacterium]